MAQGRDAPAGYDWAEDSVPSEPGPLALPDHRQGETGERPAGRSAAESAEGPGTGVAEPDDAGEGDPHPLSAFDDAGPYGAPAFTYAPQPASDESARRRGILPAWAIVAIVALQASALVASVALVVGGLQRMIGEEPDPAAAPASEEPSDPAPSTPAPSIPAPTAPSERTPGTVTDSSGRELTDGTGGDEKPAVIGEHTVSWTAWTDGTISVTAHAVDLAATVPGAGGEDVVQDGYRLVLVDYEVRYDGPGQLAPAEELWLTGESARTYFPDIGEGMVPDPMKRIGPLQGGESERFHSAFLVPEAEIDTFLLGVETFSGEILYFSTT
ncbi:hypothetical protein [Brachybacterium sp.]|uniref:hypothetical protein n=1 Tax=Brachybacterium sp. TaxID=1891286 RepID=UPI002ED349BF